MCASMATHGNRVEPWRAKTARNLLFTPQMGLSQCHSDETVRGYSANVTETCEGELNLIVDVQVEPATAADNAYLKE